MAFRPELVVDLDPPEYRVGIGVLRVRRAQARGGVQAGGPADHRALHLGLDADIVVLIDTDN